MDLSQDHGVASGRLTNTCDQSDDTSIIVSQVDLLSCCLYSKFGVLFGVYRTCSSTVSADPILVCLPVTEMVLRFLVFGVIGGLVFAWFSHG